MTAEAKRLKPVQPGRTPCVGRPAGCGRTFPDEGDQVVCSKCFKKAPMDLRKRFRDGWRNYRKMNKAWQRRVVKHGEESREAETAKRLANVASRQINDSFDAIKAFLVSPPDRPEGIDDFLTEMGFEPQTKKREG